MTALLPSHDWKLWLEKLVTSPTAPSKVVRRPLSFTVIFCHRMPASAV